MHRQYRPFLSVLKLNINLKAVARITTTYWKNALTLPWQNWVALPGKKKMICGNVSYIAITLYIYSVEWNKTPLILVLWICYTFFCLKRIRQVMTSNLIRKKCDVCENVCRMIRRSNLKHIAVTLIFQHHTTKSKWDDFQPDSYQGYDIFPSM